MMKAEKRTQAFPFQFSDGGFELEKGLAEAEVGEPLVDLRVLEKAIGVETLEDRVRCVAVFGNFRQSECIWM